MAIPLAHHIRGIQYLPTRILEEVVSPQANSTPNLGNQCVLDVTNRVSSAKGSQQTTFKRETAYEQGRSIGYSQQEITPQRDATAGLVGVANESNVNINGLTVGALIDTGATVFTVFIFEDFISISGLFH